MNLGKSKENYWTLTQTYSEKSGFHGLIWWGETAYLYIKPNRVKSEDVGEFTCLVFSVFN